MQRQLPKPRCQHDSSTKLECLKSEITAPTVPQLSMPIKIASHLGLACASPPAVQLWLRLRLRWLLRLLQPAHFVAPQRLHLHTKCTTWCSAAIPGAVFRQCRPCDRLGTCIMACMPDITLLCCIHPSLDTMHKTGLWTPCTKQDKKPKASCARGCLQQN